VSHFFIIFAENYSPMDLSKILSIAGKPGLFKVVSQGKNSVIVESLIDSRRTPAFAHEKMSSMEEISVFTTGEDLPLKEVFRTFHTKLEGKPTIDPKSANDALKKFFADMVPDFDRDRVYVSDIKKILSWYNTLLQHGLIDFTEEETEKTPDEPATESTEPEEKPEQPS